MGMLGSRRGARSPGVASLFVMLCVVTACAALPFSDKDVDMFKRIESVKEKFAEFAPQFDVTGLQALQDVALLEASAEITLREGGVDDDDGLLAQLESLAAYVENPFMGPGQFAVATLSTLVDYEDPRMVSAMADALVAVKARHESPHAWITMNETLRKLALMRRMDEAKAIGSRAVDTFPTHEELAYNYLIAFQTDFTSYALIKEGERLLERFPSFCRLHAMVGHAYNAAKMFGEGTRVFGNAVEMCPHLASSLLLSAHYTAQFQSEERIHKLVMNALDKRPDYIVIQPFTAFLLNTTNEVLGYVARAFQKRFMHSDFIPIPLLDLRECAMDTVASRPLRVGFHTASGVNHVVPYVIYSLISAMSRDERIEVFFLCQDESYVDRTNDDKRVVGENLPFVNTFRETVPNKHDLSKMSTDRAGMVFRDLNLDVVVDTDGWTTSSRPNMWRNKLAPTQLLSFGFVGSLSLNKTSHTTADPVEIPPELAPFYSEKFVYMPRHYLINSHRELWSLDQLRSPTAAVRAERRRTYGMPVDKVIISNLSQFYKFDRRTFYVWMSVLRRVPNSVLMLNGMWAHFTKEFVMHQVSEAGVPEDRVFFTNFVEWGSMYERSSVIDLYVDTAVYGAHSTCADVMWTGTPVVALCGVQSSSRVAASMLIESGLPELVSYNHEQYEEIIVSLASDPQLLARMRARVVRAVDQGEVYDMDEYSSDYVTALRMLHELKLIHGAGEGELGLDGAPGRGGGSAHVIVADRARPVHGPPIMHVHMPPTDLAL